MKINALISIGRLYLRVCLASYHNQQRDTKETALCKWVQNNLLVMAYSHCMGLASEWYREWDWYNRKQWVLVTVPLLGPV